MSDALKVRRHLYEVLAHLPRRRRRFARKQVVLLGTTLWDRPGDGGSAGVREPRRPTPPAGPVSVDLVP